MKKNKIDYSIVIPDNVANSQCADLETVMSLIKSELNLYMAGTLRVSQVNKVNLLKIEKLFQKKSSEVLKFSPVTTLFIQQIKDGILCTNCV